MSAATAPLAQMLEDLQRRVAVLESSLGAKPSTAPSPAIASSSTSSIADPRVEKFNEIISKFVVPLRDVTATIGGDVVAIVRCSRLRSFAEARYTGGRVQGDVYLQMYKYTSKVLDMSTKCKKPNAEEKKKLLHELTQLGVPLATLKAKKDATNPNALIAALEGVAAFQWLFVEPGPMGCVELGRDGAEFYNNKVRKESKDGNKPELMTYANVMRDGFNAMLAFVKEFYKMGLEWNSGGSTIASYAPAAAASTPQSSSGGGGGAGTVPIKPVPVEEAAKLQANLFAQVQSIDQSKGKTEGLRHVTKDMKSGGSSAPVPSATPMAAAGAKPTAVEKWFPTGPAKSALVGNRYLVEFQVDQAAGLHVEQVTIKEEVYIYGCRNSVIYIDTKVKGVRIDTCKDVTFVVEAALSGVEVVNSKKIKIQVKKNVPSVAIDKTDGIIVGLSWESRSAQIVTSKSSEMNVTYPLSEAGDAEWIEQPIPEQFVTKIQTGNTLATTVSELYTH